MVPTRTVLRAAAFSSASMRKAVVVLPLVPVMPVAASLRSGWPKKAAEACGERAAAVLDLEHRQAGLKDEQMVEGLRGVGNDAERAGGDGLVDIAIAVGRAALHGDKDRAGPHAARVVLDAGDGRGRVAAGADGRHFRDEIFPIHHRDRL